jgi:hypothetical protein
MGGAMQPFPLCGVKQQFSAETLLQRDTIAFPAEAEAVAEDTKQANDKKAICIHEAFTCEEQCRRVSLNIGAQQQS